MVRQRPWSVSRHRAYRTCPRMAWLLNQDDVPRTDSPESIRGQVMHAGMAAGWKAWGVDGVTSGARLLDIIEGATLIESDRHRMDEHEIDEALETALTAFDRLRDQMNGCTMLGVEEELHGAIDGVPLMARVDYRFMRGSALCVYDGKSSKELPRREEVRRDTQLGLGAYLSADYDTGCIRVAIASIGSGVAVEVDMPPDMAEAAARRVATTARIAEQDTTFEPQRSAACGDCKVRRSCPLFATGPVPEPGTEGGEPCG